MRLSRPGSFRHSGAYGPDSQINGNKVEPARGVAAVKSSYNEIVRHVRSMEYDDTNLPLNFINK